MNDKDFQELSHLFFSTRQIIRAQLPQGKVDPNGWIRSETLHYIAHTKGPTMRDVASYVRIKAPSVTSLVGQLMRMGLVRKETDQADKRIVRLYPTEKGMKLLARYAKDCARTMRGVFSKLPSKDVTQLASLLRKVSDVHRISI